MNRLALSTLVLAVGCASAPPPPPREPIQFAVIAAPLLGAPEAADALYEVTDVLSVEPDVDLVLVVGPLFGAGKQAIESARDELIGALGALAGPVHVALGPLDLERDPELLEQLEKALPERPLELAYRSKVDGMRLLVVGPKGELPADDEEPADDPLAAPRRLVLGGPPDFVPSALRITHGPTLQLEGLSLQVPALGSGEPIYALGTLNLERGSVTVRLRSGEQDLDQEVAGPWN